MSTPHGPWFKFFHEWCSDPKVQTLSESDQRRMVMILCFACRGDEPNIELWAHSMRLKPSKLRTTIERLTAIGFLDDDLTIRNWSRRQGKSDSERQREKRTRDKCFKKSVTELSRDSHVTVTQMSRVDSEEDSEEEKNPPVCPPRDRIPYQEILKAYHEQLPMFPKVRSFEPIKPTIKTRWNEDKSRQSVQWWVDYFKSIKSMPFLMGKTDKPWLGCNLTWLIGKTNMAKVLNGQYTDRKDTSKPKVDHTKMWCNVCGNNVCQCAEIAKLKEAQRQMRLEQEAAEREGRQS